MDTTVTISADTVNQFRISNYHRKPAFWSFLPGIAGMEGIPVWCMYTNRGQAVTSFGYQDKDHSIAEFLPATWQAQLAPLYGFRTFYSVNGSIYEPFAASGPDPAADSPREMVITPWDLTLSEFWEGQRIRTTVQYSSVSNEMLPVFWRRVQITNESSHPVTLRLLDGLPVIVPATVGDGALKSIRRLLEAFSHAWEGPQGMKLYGPPAAMSDEAVVEINRERSFYGCWEVNGAKLKPLTLITDPDVIFGEDQDFIGPRNFFENAEQRIGEQITCNRLPSALAYGEISIAPGETVTLTAIAGHAKNEELLNQFLASYLSTENLLKTPEITQHEVELAIAPAFSCSGSPVLDGYVHQTFLDNLLRGGAPVLFPSREGGAPVHAYCRRHGDAERDYNFFQLPARPWSEGSGNFRDICQNRRLFPWHYPQVAESQIYLFLRLLQPDGYNALGIHGYNWKHSDPASLTSLLPVQTGAALAQFNALLEKGCQPGDLLNWARDHGCQSHDLEWLRQILAECSAKLFTTSDETGYWVDHWTYIQDLLEAYQAIYPEKTAAMLADGPALDWIQPPVTIPAPEETWIQTEMGPRQHCVPKKLEAPLPPFPEVSPLAKWVMLLAVKAMTLDPEGRGLEMEAGRPGWNDAMNGLPGVFGSSTGETAEILRSARWLCQLYETFPDLQLPDPCAELLLKLCELLASGDYPWAAMVQLRGDYRASIYTSVSGELKTVPGESVKDLLQRIVNVTRTGLQKAKDPETGLIRMYYRRESQNGHAATMRPDQLAAHPLPHFLEGQVHYLRVADDPEEARSIYRGVRESGLYDEELQMYLLNESLKNEPLSVGRARAFPPGIFENESVWLHMSYKYLLELIRNGLYEEFFSDAETMLVPMMNPDLYGRSILENSSFIGSSRSPDLLARGRGYVARLSGSTAEFLHIWSWLTIGQSPFTMTAGQLHFSLQPVLPAGWFRTEPVTAKLAGKTVDLPEHSFFTTFLGSLSIVYHNPQRKNTFGEGSVSIQKYRLDNGREFSADGITGEAAEAIRNLQHQRIDVHLQ